MDAVLLGAAIALAPFYVFGCAIGAAITFGVLKYGTALLGNAHELQDQKTP